MEKEYIEYKWEEPDTCAHKYITPVIIKIIRDLNLNSDAKILDAGCGGGNLVYTLYKMGFNSIYGFDASKSGIDVAKKNFPEISNQFFIHDAYETKLPTGIPVKFNVIISMEVIEHLYSPKTYLENIYKWLEDDGYLILTTPYHGYLKNLAIALLNKFDNHFNPLWEGGHIKFFSKYTLFQILKDVGFRPIKFSGCGRIPYLWKSMVVLCKK
jgi:2-polyprenyl-3-methyl-5-hydroxy-6-metoxy-1,4-benzoquinol methylase